MKEFVPERQVAGYEYPELPSYSGWVNQNALHKISLEAERCIEHLDKKERVRRTQHQSNLYQPD